MIWQFKEIVAQTRKRIKVVQNWQKSYADLTHCELEFKVNDLVFLAVSHSKENMRFEKKWKLSLRYIGLFSIIKRVGDVAYELTLVPHSSAIHPAFHISMLRKYITDSSHIINFKEIELPLNLSWEEQAFRILYHE